MAAAEKGKKKRAPLSSFTILLIILVVLAIVTVIMSASGVEGVQGATLSQVLTAPVFGFQDAIGVCLFVMILGGFLGIVTETGALDAGIAALVHKLKGNELVLIPILMAIFSIGGTTYGMCEETVPFYLLLAATMVAAGFDSLTGAAVVLLGAGVGVMGSTVNPFAVGVAVDALNGIGVSVNQGHHHRSRRDHLARVAGHRHRLRDALRQEGEGRQGFHLPVVAGAAGDDGRVGAEGVRDRGRR